MSRYHTWALYFLTLQVVLNSSCFSIAEATARRNTYKHHKKCTMSLCLFLMTKNDWPSLQSWILYHGELVGMENIHVIDDSDDVNALMFLKRAQEKKKLKVTYTNSSLSDLSNEITNIMLSSRPYCDFMMKMDTDEFLAVYSPETEAINIQKPFLDAYLSNLIFDGKRYQIGHLVSSVPSRVCGDPSTSITSFTLSRVKDEFKAILPSKTFKSIDLGGHRGAVDSMFTGTAHRTDLAIVHFHERCYHDVIQSAIKAVHSHKYVDKYLPEDRQHEILELFFKNSTSPCAVDSCHKIVEWYHHVKDPVENERKFYEDTDAKSQAAGVFRFTDLQRKITELIANQDFVKS
jgi:hypothetical protein